MKYIILIVATMISSLSFALPDRLSCILEGGTQMEIYIGEEESYLEINEVKKEYKLVKGVYFYTFSNAHFDGRDRYYKNTIVLDVNDLYISFNQFIANREGFYKTDIIKGTCVFTQIV